MSESVFLGAATLEPGRGGIARVGRMTAQALVDEGRRLQAVSYLDKGPITIAGSRAACAGGSKLRYLALKQLHGRPADRVIYDSLGMARGPIFGRGNDFTVWMHGIEVWEGLRASHAAVLRRARRVLVNSRYTLERFERLHGPLPQARVCWLATEDDDEAPSRPLRGGPPTVLVLARIAAGDVYKGHEELIDAWPTVTAQIPEARLVIAGDGDLRSELQRRAASRGVGALVEFTGFVQEAALPELWSRADVFAMPSRKEGFGLVYIEAMRQGLPVVASCHDAGQEVNLDGLTGFNVDLTRQGELAARLIRLLGDVDLRQRMGEAGRDLWRRNFRFSAFRTRLNTQIRRDAEWGASDGRR